jgi:hypothetical protein
LTRTSTPAPFHRAFDGEEGLDQPFPPTRLSKEAEICIAAIMTTPCIVSKKISSRWVAI